MHLGKSFLSNKTQRKYKRAIILIRAAIMRENLSNVMASVNNIQNSQIEVQFKRIVRKCRSFEKLIPPLIQQLEAENYRFIQNDAKKAMMEIQHKDAQKKVQVKPVKFTLLSIVQIIKIQPYLIVFMRYKLNYYRQEAKANPSSHTQVS